MIAKDKTLHFLVSAFLALGFLITCQVLGLQIWIAPIAVMMIGIGKEVYDIWKGSPEWGDLLADLFGICAGSLVFCLTQF